MNGLRIKATAIIAGFMMVLTGCNSDEATSQSSPLTPALESIEVAVDANSLLKGTKKTVVNPGANLAVISTGSFSDGSTSDLTENVQWYVDDQAVIHENGKITIPSHANGLVTVNSKLNAVKSNTVTLEVNHLPLTSLTVMANGAQYEKGAMQQYTAQAIYVDGTSANVTDLVDWSSSNSSSTVINDEGFAFSIASGESGISASLAGIISDNVIPHIATEEQVATDTDVVGVVISNGSATISVNDTFNYRAVAGFTNGDLRDVTDEVTWHSSEPSVADIVSNGTATGLKHGKTEVSASLGGQHSDPGALSVVGDNVHDTIADLWVSPDNATVAVGENRNYMSRVFYLDGTSENVTDLVGWVSTNETVANISSKGTATGLIEGETQIFATLDGFEGKPVTLNVGISDVVEITIGTTSQNLQTGKTKQLSAIAHYSDGTTEEITDIVTWNVGMPTTLAIDNSGLATGLKAGFSSIYVTLDGVRSATMLLYVSDSNILALDIAPAMPVMNIGNSVQAVATVFYSYTDYENVTNRSAWTSSNPSVVTVDRNTGFIVAKGTGTAEIHAVFDNTISDQPISVTVE
ncbi:Ig-like domain-containing protein [Vibrio sp. ZSDE26]|uniref:Ig-like domain-containing protein n=1 Tax=Vibrio amylolyticus TaxID=2847292 RepID=A0A9X1XKD0_9VIBR|nr:Ig-like domain-containing protein [Vibrio amylolyticus]MCK6264542.1 Ig-like domain-containing protein [Vibrio amylolyticus]